MSLGHIAAGYFTAVAVERRWGNIRPTAYLWLETLSVTFALAPDADVLLSWVRGEGIRHTLPFTHSFIFYLILILPFSFLLRSRGKELASCVILLAALGGVSHIVLDFFSHGVMCLYPIDKRLFSLYGASELKSFGESTLIQPFLFLELASVVITAHHVVRRRDLSQKAMRSVTAVSIVLVALLVVCYATLEVNY